MIAAALDAVLHASPTAIIDHARDAARFVLGHHHVESTILFPGLRRRGHDRTADLAFLDRCDREHVAIHALAERLLDHAGRPHPRAGELVIVTGDLAHAMAAHVAEEEAGLAPDRLRVMIDAAGLAEIGAKLEAARGQPPR